MVKVKRFFKRILSIMFDILLTFEINNMRTNSFYIFLLFILITLSSCKVLKKKDCDCPNFGLNNEISEKSNS